MLVAMWIRPPSWPCSIVSLCDIEGECWTRTSSCLAIVMTSVTHLTPHTHAHTHTHHYRQYHPSSTTQSDWLPYPTTNSLINMVMHLLLMPGEVEGRKGGYVRVARLLHTTLTNTHLQCIIYEALLLPHAHTNTHTNTMIYPWLHLYKHNILKQWEHLSTINIYVVPYVIIIVWAMLIKLYFL